MASIPSEQQHPSLDNLDPAEFLATHWQRAPLLVRSALPANLAGVPQQRLLELATSDDVESRTVQRHRAPDSWQLEQGPVAPGVMSGLPERDWTLLVQGADLWEPGVRDVLHAFDFLPRWRLDDVMVSLATPGGGVGPHSDQYDVFLLQVEGRREWQIGSAAELGQSGDIAPERFKAAASWELEPGDLLYLPPGVPHWGTAITECQTWSVGFRAPTLADMLGDLAIELMAQDNDPRFTDPPLTPAMAGATVDPAFFKRARAMLQQLLDDDQLIEDWFCRYMTAPKYPDLTELTGESRQASVHGRRYCNGELTEE
ncbi:MAG: cupin domain-containing protein [Pseudomonadales bacterium]